jgi:hypothetical protein
MWIIFSAIFPDLRIRARPAPRSAPVESDDTTAIAPARIHIQDVIRLEPSAPGLIGARPHGVRPGRNLRLAKIAVCPDAFSVRPSSSVADATGVSGT